MKWSWEILKVKKSPIKWRNYEIKILIDIRGNIEEEFAKSAIKQGTIHLCIIFI